MNSAVKLTTSQDIIDVVKDISQTLAPRGGLKQVYGVACGGSFAGVQPIHYLLRAEAKNIHSDGMTANEFIYATPKQLGPNSVVVAMSRAGDTPETVAACKVAKEQGAVVITLSISKDVPLAEHSDHHLIWAGDRGESQVYGNSAIVLRLGYELLREFENYAHYDEAVAAFGQLDGLINPAIEAAKAKAAAWANTYQNDEVIYTVGSGVVYNVAYSTSICHLMEMEWIHSSSFHSGEFFHGPFEITDEHVPFMIFMTGGPTRPLDERALAFLKKHSKEVEAIDARDYKIDRIAPALRESVSFLLLSAVGRVYTETLAEVKQHPFLYRKYMFKEAY